MSIIVIELAGNNTCHIIYQHNFIIMKYRTLGKTGFKVSEVSLGTWQLGGRWGSGFDEKAALATVHAAIDHGINFIDTADVYSDGLSERAVAIAVKTRKEKVYVATKCGRRLSPHTAEGYNQKNITRFIDDSLRNTGFSALDLVQLHCPPTEVYTNDRVFEVLDRLKEQGKIRHYGVSVEKVDEALMALKYPGVAIVQIIFNMFRLKPAERFFPEAIKNNVGILARVPLASGLLTGKLTRASVFAAGDHRTFNRHGEAFDKGETFSGVDFDLGLMVVDKLKRYFPDPENLASSALRWILMFEAVSCVIPGASSPEQAVMNAAVPDMPGLTGEQMSGIEDIYDRFIRKDVHHLW